MLLYMRPTGLIYSDFEFSLIYHKIKATQNSKKKKKERKKEKIQRSSSRVVAEAMTEHKY